MKTAILLIVIAGMSLVPAAARSETAGLDTARGLLEDHRYTEAKASIDDYLKSFPGDPDALRVKSDVYGALGEWDKAAETMEEAVSLRENDADLLLALALVYREKLMRSGLLGKMSNAKKSRKALEKAYSISPDDLKVRRRMVFYLVYAPGMAGGDKDKGKQIALETLSIDETEGRIQLAVACRQKGEKDESIAAFRRAIELDPGRGETWFMLGHTYLENEEYAAAEETFATYTRQVTGDAEPYDGLGDCFKEQRKFAEAIEQYELALEQDAWYGDARYKLAKLYKSTKKKDKAAYHYEKLIELNPGHIDVGNAKKGLRKIKKGR